MILSYIKNVCDIPHTSTCIIHTKGIIKDGSMVSITSPIFSSTNFTSRSINMSDRFDVPIHISNNEGYIINDNTLEGTLVCNDNDIFNIFAIVK